ncbi:MAG TPA: amino acid adenylation domain-containing protein [Verrucomicrobiae bacterium]|nr:amino acid adenylation domain-containing protein [Verrucomicrobiae bacterium]
MLGHFQVLLEGMAASPEKHVGQLAMLTEAERDQLLAKWNDTTAEFPEGKCVHELFEEQARRTPDALAVADGKKQWSYAELNRRADSLAAELRKFGIGPDVCVGVCLERSVEMIAAKLAVWKAGGAYVPLDPSYPAERLKFMLEDANIPVLLTQPSLRNNSQFEIPDLKLLSVDELLESRTRTKDRDDDSTPHSALRTPHSGNLAYVIYTSGSTGRPKGVEIEHRSLVNLITWHQRTYRVTPADRGTQIATPAFDASVWELWPYLTAGASIHIPDEETRLSSRKLLRWLLENKITLSFVPTPIAEAMLDEPWPEDCGLRALLTGGDKLHRAPGKKLPCMLANHYGPTENTVVTTWTLVPPIRENAHPPPIGRPLANTQVFILDQNLQPVPVSVPGELHISGVGLARGYHNCPELTAEKFIPNPFRAGSDARLYRTGDLVRWRPDGQIEFLGRMDNQVKIRGQRIELGEIEAALNRHSEVREAVIVPREDAKGEKRLAAYVVLKSEIGNRKPEINTGGLRRFLREKLPDAMIPSAFVFLDALPLTPNGKVDRTALPMPEFQVESERPFVAPRTPTEERLAAIWREVLAVERVGMHDNFFELGGHSLTATQVVARAQGAFQVELLLPDLFDAPTVAELAEKIEARARSPVRRGGVPAERRVRREDKSSGFPAKAAGPHPNGELPLSFAQERLWFMEQLEPGQAFNNIPIALRLEGALNIGALERAIAEIVRRHKPLRTVFNSAAGRPVATVMPAPVIKIPVVDLSSLPAEEREKKAVWLASEEAREPLDLSQSPLLRAKLVRLAADAHLLLFTTHHILCDGWSAGIFYRELTALYEAFLQGRPSPLPELSSDYADYVRSQRTRLQGDVLPSQLDFWKQQLAGAQTTLDLPTDRPRPPVQTYRGATRHFAWPQRLASSLNAVARQEEVTLFMLLLAAFETLLHRYTGQEDILVGSPIAGRTMVETEPLIGFFLNTLVLRGDLSGDPTFRELLQRVRQTALAAYAHQEIPFEKLVEALQPARDLSRPPLFQVMFILQNAPLRSLELAGLKLAPLQVHSSTAKFDLMLSLEEGAGGLSGFIEYNTDLFDAETIARLLDHYRMLLESVAVSVQQPLSQLPLLTEPERKQILADWNDSDAGFPGDRCIHELFQEQVRRTPDAAALVFEDEELTYRELDKRANQLARELHTLGVGPDVRVGICVRRSLEMVIGLLGILKAGGCYVPLDPAYPKERRAFMLQDSQAPVLLTQTALRDQFKSETSKLKLVCVDEQSHASDSVPFSTRNSQPSTSLAYIIYTSGSTGQPKGVMVMHRNVVNFFAGMDRVLGTRPGVWLAVTSISFDISVLELFWTLCRGFKVVIQPDDDRAQPSVPIRQSDGENVDFSLFYFANDAGNGAPDKYRLLIEGAKFADAHGFAAVWTPERHFHPFGGLYPNPSLTGVAVAMITRRLQIRAGSVCLPLHHPARVAEEWAVVDNLSNGRAAISFASGWQVNDFVLAPENYPGRKETMAREIETVQRLWRGDTVEFPDANGGRTAVKIFPQPIQKRLPIWLTAAGSMETFQLAGALGANVLTHLLGQDGEELAEKIAAYRAAWRQAGHPGAGRVALMLHTFVHEDEAEVRKIVRNPFREYLRSSVDLMKNFSREHRHSPSVNGSTGDWVDAVLERAVDRYFSSSALFGTPRDCRQMIERVHALGVDEVACLIDFGVDADSVLAGLRRLHELKEHSVQNTAVAGRRADGQRDSVSEQIERHGVTHLQCTPSLAGTLLLAPESQAAMRSLDKLLLGGEALPVSLAKRLREVLRGELLNLYGPTETTVWSAAHRVEKVQDPVPIGRPIANTQIYILDKKLRPVPVGVPGEIFIGGEGVVRGYLNRPELTVEKFIRNPFSAEASARLYRTGDLGRWRANGMIEFLGRLDHQVKIRGHRIELGEIESALARHPAVREAVVVAREDSPGDKRLTAYVVAAPKAKPTTTELRRFAQEKLPEAMVPSVFIFLDQLPLTPNGKVNRMVLPAPETARPELETAYAAPRNETEKSIAQIWQELLHVEQVGRHDNFFDLGGNSLLIVQVQARLRVTLGFDLPVVKLFQYPTVAALAGFLGERAENVPGKIRERGRRKQAACARQFEPEGAVPA